MLTGAIGRKSSAPATAAAAWPRQIADRLAIQELPVKAHVTAIFEKLRVRNRTPAGMLLRPPKLGEPARMS